MTICGEIKCAIHGKVGGWLDFSLAHRRGSKLEVR